MKKSKFSESQIVVVLQEGEAGLPVAQILRNYGNSQATYQLEVERRRHVGDRAQAPEGARGRERPSASNLRWLRRAIARGCIGRLLSPSALQRRSGCSSYR